MDPSIAERSSLEVQLLQLSRQASHLGNHQAKEPEKNIKKSMQS